jgi:hypothetical protein
MPLPDAPFRLVSLIGVYEGGNVIAGRLIEYDFADSERWRPTALNGSTFLGGGVTSVFDGARVFESGFLTAPAKVQVDATGGSGQTFVNGRCYVATYEQLDTSGNVHLSGVSAPSEITGAVTNKSVILYTTPCTITSRGDASSLFAGAVRVKFWGTLDANVGEAPYYLIGDYVSTPANRFVSLFDTIGDSELAAQPLLYGTGNLPGTGAGQDHRAPPGLKHIVAYNGMLVGAAGRVLYFTSQPIEGEGQWWSPLFSKPLDEDATGLAVQDGSVVIFTRSGGLITAGEPPSDNGFEGGFSSPRRLSIDSGCINANSILSTGKGTFYQSTRGLELLTRGLTNDYIGQPVQDTLATYPIITSAVLDSRNGLARFSLVDTVSADGVVDAGGSGLDVVYDLVLNVWISRDRKTLGDEDSPTQDACMGFVDDAWRYALLMPLGVVYYENLPIGDAYLDGAEWITMRAVTPWCHVAGIQGEQLIDQVLLLAKKVSTHQVSISLAYDYVDDWGTPKVFTTSLVDSLAREWLVKEVAQTTSNAIRVKIEDGPGDSIEGSGAGAKWIAATLSGQAHRGPKRTSGAQRGGTS